MKWNVDAPNGGLSIQVDLDDGALRYGVSQDGKPIVNGALGLQLDSVDLRAGLKHRHIVERDSTSNFSLPHGKARSATADFSEVEMSFEDETATTLVVVARVYDDGVAFRYVLPDDRRRTVVDEATTFEFAADGRAWIQPTDAAAYSRPAYEALHANAVPIGHTDDVPSWNLPALFEVDETFVLLTESDTDETYCGGHIDPIESRSAYRWVAPQEAEGDGVGERLPTHDGPWTLPWRVLAIGDLATVAETNLVQLLARGGRTPADWIRPGKVTWSWWSDHDSSQNPAVLKEFVDFAAELDWPHTLIDANWNLIDQDELRGVIEYAGTKDVGVFLWYNSGGPNNVVTEQPRDRMFDRDVRRDEFARLGEWGVAGIKVDFWHSDKAESNARYLALAADAYDAGLMVNFHGSTIPRGWEVRFPNIMTMEGVRGAEQYSFEENYSDDAPWLNTILPFTRNVVGSMDYTPVTFSDVKFPHTTTNAHELALAVVFESALQHFADSPDSYRSQSGEVCDFLRRVPAVWDETRVLSGYPGDHAVFARRLADEWWIGGINGTDTSMSVDLDLGFVGGGAATLFSDDGPRRIAARRTALEAAQTVTMEPRGGFAIAPAPSGGSGS